MLDRIEMPSRKEGVFFKTAGVISISVGLVLFGMFACLAWARWRQITEWPHANATVVNKEISKTGARLVVKYRVNGRQFSGVAFRWGSENEIRNSLATSELGTIQVVAYNPRDPTEVSTYLTCTWEAFIPALSGALLALLFVAGGVTVKSWAHGWRTAH